MVQSRSLRVADVKLHRNGLRLMLNQAEGNPGTILYGRNLEGNGQTQDMSNELWAILDLLLSSMAVLYVRVNDSITHRSLDLVVVAEGSQLIELLGGVVHLINRIRGVLDEPAMALPAQTISKLTAQGVGFNIALSTIEGGLPAEVQRAVNAYLDAWAA